MWGRYDGWHHRPSRPKAVKGGIKAQSKRGSFGENWWAKRWVAVLEGFDIGARLGRGKSYARQGQVLSIDITKGRVKAKVQGSRPTPYEVTIELAPPTPAEWAKVEKSLAGEAVFAAKLLAGEMPAEIEKIAADAGVSLFPSRSVDLHTDCSCPDWSNPCKHVAAVYYLLAEEFDRDPFLLFRLRGLERDELFANLSAVAAEKPEPPRKSKEPAEVAQPLPADPRSFWHAGELPADLFHDVSAPPVAAALARRLGSFPFWRGGERFLDAMETAYRAAGERGMTVYLGEGG
jgi:uncharacterized Zn finger protein